MIKGWRLVWKDGSPVRARHAPHRQWFLTRHSPLEESRRQFGWRLWRAEPPILMWLVLITLSTCVGLFAPDSGSAVLGLYAAAWTVSVGGGLLGFWLFTVPAARRRQWKCWDAENVMPFPYGWMRINGNKSPVDNQYWIYAERKATAEEIDGTEFVPHSISHRPVHGGDEVWLVAPILVEGKITD